MPVFLDTNIFLYAAGGRHPEREACIELLQRVSEGSLDARVNTADFDQVVEIRRVAPGSA
jgi:predicted nucleic acid-binding protein